MIIIARAGKIHPSRKTEFYVSRDNRLEVSIFTSFHIVDRDLQKYRHLQMSFTYDVIDISHCALCMTWSQKFFSAKREKLI